MHHGKLHLPHLPFHRQQAEQRVGAARHAEGDGQHIIANQGATGHHPRRRRQQFAGDQVTAAAAGKGLDDLRITRADDDNRQDGGNGDEQAQKRVRFQRDKRRFRAVTGRRQPIRAQTDPGEQGDQRGLVEQAFVGKIPRPADQHFFRQDEQFAQIHKRCRNAIINQPNRVLPETVLQGFDSSRNETDLQLKT